MVSSKQSLREDETRFTIFFKLRDRHNFPMQLPVLNINNYKIERSNSIKFFGVMTEGHLNWKDHINLMKNNLSRNLALLYQPKLFLNEKAMQRYLPKLWKCCIV